MRPPALWLSVVFFVVGASACTCGTVIVHTGDGGSGDGGGADGSSNSFHGTLLISPRDPVVDVTGGQVPPPLQFSATGDGAPVTPQWTFAPAGLGSVDPAGRFTTSGATPGVGTLSATYGTASDSTKVTIRVHLTQNGDADGGTHDAGAGGWGGVGGEGVGGAVTPVVLTVLHGTPTADPGASLLYPYDGTVWPRGILAPLLQWNLGAHPYEAVLIRAECSLLSWEGAFSATATPFVHHPIPQTAWQQLTDGCSGKNVTVTLVFASGGVAYGPLVETWKVAPGFLKGVVYYNSYGTKLAKNYSGAMGGDGRFGGATLAVRGGSTDPTLIAGKDGAEADCRVCHVVSGDGSTLLSQRGNDYQATSAYALKAGNAETAMSPADGRFAWGGISPDGTFLFSNAAPIAGGTTSPSALYRVPAGTTVAATGIPAGLEAATPAFSADGTKVAFNWFAGAAVGGTGDQRSLALMSFAPPGTFSDFAKLFTPPVGQTVVYPSFLPSGAGVVFQVETVSNGRGFGETRSLCDGSGVCSESGARGELWWVDLATKQAVPLDKLNGKGTLPTGPNAHADDATLNFEPTVSPIYSGGYAWAIFTSRRLYGNVATTNPYWSDPRYHDMNLTPTTKKLWVAAIDSDAVSGTDPSHPAFYLPAQELFAGNSRGYWALNPCRADHESCVSGDECCGGYCRPQGEVTNTCSSDTPACALEYEKCTTSDDCCDKAAGALCVNSRCSLPIIN
jgi:hypothetical protein